MRTTTSGSTPAGSAPPPARPPTARHGSIFVAAGILISRLFGFVRLRVFAHYFGLQSDAADAFYQAVRIPSFLQALFGEGALSASFIPVYAAALGRGNAREADRVAGAVGALVALLIAVFVAVGVMFAPTLSILIAPGFTGEKRALTITLVRILFPSAGLLTFSAWCLGVLNSHHRFLLSYAAPVMWNVAMIATLVAFGSQVPLPRLAELLAWGSVAGAALQCGVQLPVVRRVAPHLRISFDLASIEIRTVLRNFGPAALSRGVMQVSAYIDSFIASWLPTGAVTGLANTQLLYTLPVSLFGVSIAAAELPAMAQVADSPETLRARLQTGLRRIAFFVVPSAAAFLSLGDVIAAALLQTGRFRHEDAVYVWAILAGSAIGLLASTLARLYASAYFALQDTRTPLRCAVVRVGLTSILGYAFALPLPRWLGIPPIWGAAGLTASAGLAGWVEMFLLRRGINRRIGAANLPGIYLTKLWTAATAGAGLSWLVKLSLPPLHPVIVGALVLGSYGITFLGLTLAFRVPEATSLVKRIRRF